MLNFLGHFSSFVQDLSLSFLRRYFFRAGRYCIGTFPEEFVDRAKKKPCTPCMHALPRALPPATRRTPDMIGDARKMDSLPDNLFDGIFDKGVARTRVWLEIEVASRAPSCLNAFE